MANRHAPSVCVPQLKAKLKDLYRHSTNVKEVKALGARLGGIGARAIDQWSNRSDAKDSGTMPHSRFEELVAVFLAELPGPRAREEVRAFLLSDSYEHLRAAWLAVEPNPSWSELVAQAPLASAQLVRVDDGSMQLTQVSSRRESGGDALQCPTDKQFRLHLRSPIEGWLAVVQVSDQGNHGVLLDDAATLAVPAREFVLPRDGETFFESEPGSRTFVFLVIATPFPTDVASRLLESARGSASLDLSTLERLARLGTSSPTCSLTKLRVDFYEAG